MQRKAFLCFVIFLALLLAATVAFLYFGRAVLPAKIKKIAIEKIEEFSGRPAQIVSARFSFLRGFIVEGLTIFEKESKQTPFLYIKKLSFRVLYLPLLREKKVIIPSVVLEHPQGRLTRYPGNLWNFSDILEKFQKPTQTAPQPFTPVIAGLVLENAKILFSDESLAQPFRKTFEGINLKVKFALPRNVKFSLHLSLPDSPSPGILSAEGNYELPSKKLSSHVVAENISLSHYIPFYYTPPSFFFEEGTLTNGDFRILFEEGKMSVKGKFDTASLRLRTKTGTEFSGNPSGAIDLTYNPGAERKFSYEGFIDTKGATLTGVPLAGNLSAVNGKINFEPGKIRADSLSFTALETAVEVGGTLTNFADPRLKISGKTQDFLLEKLQTLFPKLFQERKITASGHSSLVFHYDGPLLPQTETGAPRPFDVNVSATLNNASLNFATPDINLKEITGRVIYTPDKISLEGISTLLFDSRAKVAGSITNLKNPILNIAASASAVDLEKLNGLFPGIFKKTSVESLSGRANLNLNFEGSPFSFQDANFKLTAFLENSVLRVRQLPEAVEALSGKLTFIPDNLFFEDFKGTFKGVPYALESKIKNLKEPVITASLSSDNAALEGRFKIAGETVEVSLFKGRYFNCLFDVKGDVFTKEGSSPFVRASGSLQLALKNLFSLFPAIGEKLKPLNPDGDVTLKGTMEGPLTNLENWQILADATSPKVSLYGYQLKNLAVNLSQNDDRLFELKGSADTYEGKLILSSSLDLADTRLPYTLDAQLENADITKLKNDTTLKAQNISGVLSADLIVLGDLRDAESMEGKGSIAIQDGRLWQLNLLKGLGQFLFIPEFENIVFNEAHGDFLIRDKKVSTGNLELLSPQSVLTVFGWIDFGGNINFDVATEFSSEMIASSASFKKALTAILTEGEAYLTIKVTGTLKEPKYAVSPTGVLHKTKKLLIDGWKSIFE